MSVGGGRGGTSDRTLIQSLQRGLRLIEVIGERDRVHAKELAHATGIALPTTYHLLRTLVCEGYVTRLDDGSYVLGDQLQLVAAQGHRTRAVPRVRALLREVSENFGASAYLALYVDGEIIGNDAILSTRLPCIPPWDGNKSPGHATAMGKCILANLTFAERLDYLTRHPMESLTARTIVGQDRLEYELMTATVAWDREEYFSGIGCLAVPVRCRETLGALGLAFPASRFRRNPSMTPTALTQVAGEISRALTWPSATSAVVSHPSEDVAVGI